MGFKQVIRKILLHTDFLAQPYDFKVHHNQKNGTAFGGILSIIMGIIILFYGLIIFSEEMNDDNLLYQSVDQEMDMENDFLDQDNLNFIFQIMKLNQETGEQQYLKKEEFDQIFTAQLIEQQVDNQLLDSFIYENIFEIDNCNEEQIKSIDQRLLKEKNINFCYKEQTKYIIKGNYLENKYSKIKLRINFKNLQEIPENDNYYIRFLVQEQSINNMENLKHVDIKQKMTKLLEQITNHQSLNISMGIFDMEKEIAQSTQLIRGQISVQKEYIKGVNVAQQNKEYHGNPSFDVNVDLSRHKLQYVKRHKNFLVVCLNILSKAGGLLTIIVAFATFFYKYYYRHKIYESLMNETFIFNIKQENTQNLNVKVKAGGDKKRLKNPLLQQFNYQISYGYFVYLIVKFKQRLIQWFGCEKNVNIDKDLGLFQNSKKKLQMDLDLMHIVKKMYEIDKLKLLLLNKDQLILFNTLVTPVINVDEEIFKPSKIEKKKDEKVNKSETLDKILKKKKKSDIFANQIIQKAYHPGNLKNSFRSPFFKSAIEECNGKKLIEAYQRVKDSTSQEINSDEEADQNNKINKDWLFKQEFHNLTKGFSQKLLKLLQMNTCIFNVIQFQEQLTQMNNKRQMPQLNLLQNKNRTINKTQINLYNKSYRSSRASFANPSQNFNSFMAKRLQKKKNNDLVSTYIKNIIKTEEEQNTPKEKKLTKKKTRSVDNQSPQNSDDQEQLQQQQRMSLSAKEPQISESSHQITQNNFNNSMIVYNDSSSKYENKNNQQMLVNIHQQINDLQSQLNKLNLNFQQDNYENSKINTQKYHQRRSLQNPSVLNKIREESRVLSCSYQNNNTSTYTTLYPIKFADEEDYEEEEENSEENQQDDIECSNIKEEMEIGENRPTEISQQYMSSSPFIHNKRQSEQVIDQLGYSFFRNCEPSQQNFSGSQNNNNNDRISILNNNSNIEFTAQQIKTIDSEEDSVSCIDIREHVSTRKTNIPLFQENSFKDNSPKKLISRYPYTISLDQQTDKKSEFQKSIQRSPNTNYTIGNQTEHLRDDFLLNSSNEQSQYKI